MKQDDGSEVESNSLLQKTESCGKYSGSFHPEIKMQSKDIFFFFKLKF